MKGIGHSKRMMLTLLTAASWVGSTQTSEACLFRSLRARHTAAVAVPTQAVACNTCAVATPAPVMSAYVPAACDSCNTCTSCAPPQPIAVQTTCMTQRCYMAPVTTMQTQAVVEPVTTYQRSCYLEPVTTFRTSAYYDPCSCSYHSVQTPVTSYVQREQVTPTTAYVTRQYQVPVTTYEKRCVQEPVTQTQYYYPATAAPAVAVAPAAAPVLSNYWAPVAVAPAQMVAPAPAVAMAPAAPTGQSVERNYYQSNQGQGTELIERHYFNGQIKKETKMYYAPGEQVPAPKQGDDSARANPPLLLKPVPLTSTSGYRPSRNFEPNANALTPVSAYYR